MTLGSKLTVPLKNLVIITSFIAFVETQRASTFKVPPKVFTHTKIPFALNFSINASKPPFEVLEKSPVVDRLKLTVLENAPAT